MGLPNLHICPGVRGKKKGLASLQSLDFISFFLAPRPGLEPGTYGLTGGRSKCAAGRANPHFLPVARSISSVRRAPDLPGRTPERPLDMERRSQCQADQPHGAPPVALAAQAQG